MVRFTAKIERFDEQGEKTGWTYIQVPGPIASKLKPGNKKSFRVKGMLDDYPITSIALLPMGEGNFIMALNAAIRKNIRKRKGDRLKVQLEADDKPVKMDSELMTCLADEPKALAFFNSLAGSHRNYFSKWVGSAKTATTKSKRIAQAIEAFLKSQNFGEMLRHLQNERKKFSGQ